MIERRNQHHQSIPISPERLALLNFVRKKEQGLFNTVKGQFADVIEKAEAPAVLTLFDSGYHHRSDEEVWVEQGEEAIHEHWTFRLPHTQPEVLAALLTPELAKNVQAFSEGLGFEKNKILSAATFATVMTNCVDRTPFFMPLEGGPEGIMITYGPRRLGLYGPKIIYYSTYIKLEGKPLLSPVEDIEPQEWLFAHLFGPALLCQTFIREKQKLLSLRRPRTIHNKPPLILD